MTQLRALATRLSQGSAVTQRYARNIIAAVEATAAGKKDDGLAFQLDIVQAWLSSADQPADAVLILGLSRQLREFDSCAE